MTVAMFILGTFVRTPPMLWALAMVCDTFLIAIYIVSRAILSHA